MVIVIGQKGEKMGRLLDEDDVIEIIERRLQHSHDNVRRRKLSELFIEGNVDAYLRIRSDVQSLPSAQPEQRWISVKERLPDKETYVLISKKPRPLTGKKWCVTIAGRFVDGRSRELEWRDIGFGRIADDEILAWCELPEPYKVI